MTTPFPAAPVGCGWPVDSTVVACFSGYTPEVRALASTYASEILYGLTGRRFGVCPVTVRPAEGGQVRLDLVGPVHEVTEVKIDGQVLAAAAYRVDDHRVLVRLDGDAWPAGQDLLLAEDAPGTFSVTYGLGEPVPEGGAIAAGWLAAEFAKAFTDDKTCRLPQRVRSVARQGVTIEAADPQAYFAEGRTGLYEVDLWLRQVNPYGNHEASRVFSPDVPRNARRSS